MKHFVKMVLIASLLGACQQQTEPAEPVWGKHACSACKMLLSEPRFAAQTLERTGERLYFDDIGCLAEHLNTHVDDKRGIWVRNEASGWSDARLARFATGAKSPMDYGFVVAADGKLDFNAVKHSVRHRTAGHAE